MGEERIDGSEWRCDSSSLLCGFGGDARTEKGGRDRNGIGVKG